MKKILLSLFLIPLLLTSCNQNMFDHFLFVEEREGRSIDEYPFLIKKVEPSFQYQKVLSDESSYAYILFNVEQFFSTDKVILNKNERENLITFYNHIFAKSEFYDGLKTHDYTGANNYFLVNSIDEENNKEFFSFVYRDWVFKEDKKVRYSVSGLSHNIYSKGVPDDINPYGKIVDDPRYAVNGIIDAQYFYNELKVFKPVYKKQLETSNNSN